MYLGKGEVLPLLLVLAVSGGRGEVPGDRLVCYYDVDLMVRGYTVW